MYVNVGMYTIHGSYGLCTTAVWKGFFQTLIWDSGGMLLLCCLPYQFVLNSVMNIPSVVKRKTPQNSVPTNGCKPTNTKNSYEEATLPSFLGVITYTLTHRIHGTGIFTYIDPIRFNDKCR